jgi:hypothetical protein
MLDIIRYGNTGRWVFKRGVQDWKDFCLKINSQHTQRKLLNLKNWCNGKVSKSAKICRSESIFYVKNHRNLSQFFSLKHVDLGVHFLLETFFDYIDLWINLFYKMNFWQQLHQFSKFNHFLLGILIFRQTYFQFCTPCLKTRQPLLP